jgi:hypothetical protein
MLVSGFALEYNGFTNGNQNPAYTSGYELEITNLSNHDIQFDVAARVTRYAFAAFAPPESPAAVLANLKELIPGVKKNDLWNWFVGGWDRDADGFVLRITMPIAAGTSELFYMIPFLYQSRSWSPRVAGHVELTVPAVRSTEPPYKWVPQSDGPVPVMLNPSTVESREVRKAGGLFSESRTSPPLTTGQAYNEIEAEKNPRVMRVSVRDYLNVLRNLGATGVTQGVVGMSPEDRAQALIDLLEAIGDDEDELAALNGVLKELGSAARVGRSTGRE